MYQRNSLIVSKEKNVNRQSENYFYMNYRTLRHKYSKLLNTDSYVAL